MTSKGFDPNKTRESNSNWQKTSQANARAKQHQRSGVPLKRSVLKVRSVKGARNEAALARLKPKLIAINPMCWRCGVNVGTDPHHRAGRTGWRMLYMPLLCLLCRWCHCLCKDQPAQMMSEGWIVSRHIDYRAEPIPEPMVLRQPHE